MRRWETEQCVPSRNTNLRTMKERTLATSGPPHWTWWYIVFAFV